MERARDKLPQIQKVVIESLPEDMTHEMLKLACDQVDPFKVVAAGFENIETCKSALGSFLTLCRLGSDSKNVNKKMEAQFGAS
jgi:hypothetical protein